MMNRQTIRRLTVLFFIGWLGLVSGCGKEDKGPVAGPKPGPVVPGPESKGGGAEVPAQFAAARQIFDSNCAKCHTTDPSDKGFAGFPGKGAWPPEDKKFPPGGDKGFKPPQDKKFPPGGFKGMMRKGPNLAKVGADPRHTRDWFVAYIGNPQSQNPRSRMPKFEDKLDADSLGKLADYLGSLK